VLFRSGDQPAFEAVISYIHSLGPLVRLELQRADHTDIVEAELTRDRFKELAVSEGDTVFVSPKNVRVFLEQTA